MGWLEGWLKRTEISNTEDGGGAKNDYAIKFDAFRGLFCAVENSGSFEWHSSPAERYVGTYDKTYFGFYCPDSTVKIREWNARTKVPSDAVTLWSSWGAGDDHSCPSVHVIKNHSTLAGFILVASSNRDTGETETRRSSAKESVTDGFEGAKTVVSDASTTTYGRMVEVDDGSNGIIFIFYRKNVAPEKHYFYQTSTDGGDTWGNETQITDFDEFAGEGASTTYLHPWAAVDGKGTAIHLMMNIHYTSNYRLDIWYMKTDDATASPIVWEEADGTGITLPCKQTNGDLAYETPNDPDRSALANFEEYTVLWDIKVIGGIVYMIHLSDTSDPTWPLDPPAGTVKIRRTHYDGGWSTEDITDTAAFIEDNFYFGGCVLDEYDADTVYAGIKDGSNNSQMQIWKKNGAWAKDTDITTASTGSHYRPIYVKNGADYFKLFWGYTERYAGPEDNNWGCMLMAWPGFSNQNFIRMGLDCRTDFGDVRFATIDGITLQPAASSGCPWIQIKTDSFRATLWVKVGNIPAAGGNIPIWCYYGKADATNPNGATEMDAQFTFADHFASLDAGDWDNVGGGAAVADSELQLDNDDAVIAKAAYAAGHEIRCLSKADEQDISLEGASESDETLRMGTGNEPSTYLGANYVRGTQYTPTNDGWVRYIALKSNASGNAKVAIYSESGGEPNNLLAGESTGQAISAGWNMLDLGSYVSVQGGTAYWLLHIVDVADGCAYTASDGQTSGYEAETYAGFTWAGWTLTNWFARTHNYELKGYGIDTEIIIYNSDAAGDAGDFDAIRVRHIKEHTTYIVVDNDPWLDFQNINLVYILSYISGSKIIYGQGDNGAYGLYRGTATTYIPDGPVYPRFYVWDSSQESQLDIDWIIVRPITDPEPVTKVSAEESSPVPKAGFVNFQIPAVV